MDSIGDSNTLKVKHWTMNNETSEPNKNCRQLLTTANRTFKFLEHQGLVDFVETNGEYIVSTGRDHDINIWDAVEGIYIRSLSGHSGPVTGLHMISLDKEPPDTIVVTSSEDGTIRQWSIKRGEQLKRFGMDTVITCMGVMDNCLVVTGNYKGHLSVQDLSSGDSHSSILAHKDPIDAIIVKDNYACSATFDSPSCLKVWEIKSRETIVCLYQIEESFNMEFGSLALTNTTVILGASTQPKLYVMNFVTGNKEEIELEKSTGIISTVKAEGGWIFCCASYRRDTFLQVYKDETYKHYGTFRCNMQQVLAMSTIQAESGMKIVLGGSALAVLDFDFILLDELTVSSHRNSIDDLYHQRATIHNSYNTLGKLEDECPEADQSNSSDEGSYVDNEHIPFKNTLSYLSQKDLHKIKPKSEKFSRIMQDDDQNGDILLTTKEDQVLKQPFGEEQKLPRVVNENGDKMLTTENKDQVLKQPFSEFANIADKAHERNFSELFSQKDTEPRTTLKKLERELSVCKNMEEKVLEQTGAVCKNRQEKVLGQPGAVIDPIERSNMQKGIFTIKDKENTKEVLKEMIAEEQYGRAEGDQPLFDGRNSPNSNNQIATQTESMQKLNEVVEDIEEQQNGEETKPKTKAGRRKHKLSFLKCNKCNIM